jgi:gamma-glutamylcyclotransferase (GGCT)/AIG2-like uncharacterized protein YtfP
LMDERMSYLFVYGSLLNDDNEFAVYLKQNCTFYNKGKFEGKLYEIGLYPGAIADTGCGLYVYGSIFFVDDPKVTFAVLDEYEGFGTDEPYPNEFIRQLVEIEMVNSTKMSCWVYLYNLPVKGLPEITLGNYLLYKKSPDLLQPGD